MFAADRVHRTCRVPPGSSSVTLHVGRRHYATSPRPLPGLIRRARPPSTRPFSFSSSLTASSSPRRARGVAPTTARFLPCELAASSANPAVAALQVKRPAWLRCGCEECSRPRGILNSRSVRQRLRVDEQCVIRFLRTYPLDLAQPPRRFPLPQQLAHAQADRPVYLDDRDSFVVGDQLVSTSRRAGRRIYRCA